MNPTHQFIGHATRGLWGVRKRDAALELRGAIEDKIYRHQLCGLSAADAERAALRDLGSPHAIARDLNHVHTAPAAIRATLLLGVVGLLGVQAVAQIPAVGSAFRTQDLQECRVLSPEEVASLPPGALARLQRVYAQYGGPEGLNAQCKKGAFLFPLLNVTDLLAALTAAKVPVYADPSTTSALVLKESPAGNPHISYMTELVHGQRYVSSRVLMGFVRSVTTQPFTLTGLTNPVLTIGAARIPVGTAQAPVRTVDILGAGLADARRTDTSLPLPVNVMPIDSTFAFDPAAPQLAVPGTDGEVFAVVQNIRRLNQKAFNGGDQSETLWVRARQNGRIAFTDELTPDIRLMNSQAELDQATARGVKAAVVYRVNATNLQHPVLTPVPATQVRVVKP
ncbi:permease prefix domain 1-containing protein [Deinococcus soli (ex Cha et al. 2016)]|uniref:Uncharacterized protein n=2 Tax=Deinococcus soli (ex Cha et al. 2016) TaxID=1309411 RepID=A0ACC6KMR4_9DEIO|nr:permease prefix domain 1-containing protein [Deinococcus soli (ex Cha et al. 2016)]MDR6221190.1 hypothetical protein [Deinococcus soli (ex Cha et al. 2016)]MDR6331123.1 hypothetical protein [Deinococcus soli (ex Cha et al. 2016)]MDR6753731.1 hypothetical protein [Deinococcus soli (ex Cha et al. 2016)]